MKCLLLLTVTLRIQQFELKALSNMEKTSKKEPMLFNYETTYKNDFRFGEIRDSPKIIYEVKKLEHKSNKVEYKNIYTLTQWQGEVPPFNLLHKPKDIIRTNPNDVQQYIEKSATVDHTEARRTRPRLVIPPAVSMDDIEDEHARNILCTDMYTSIVAQAAKDMVTPVKKTRELRRLFPTNPLALPKLKPSCVSPEWRMESVTWDKKQQRGYYDPTNDFWLKRKISQEI